VLFSAKKYVVNVVTGDVKNAGTDANVFLSIFGQNGDTGERQLQKSETHTNKFERNQVIRIPQEIQVDPRPDGTASHHAENCARSPWVQRSKKTRVRT